MNPRPEINRKYFDYITSLRRNLPYFRAVSALLSFVRIIFFPLIVLYAFFLVIFLGIARRIFYASKIGPFHARAGALAEEFSAQYPFHYYPLISKAMALVFMREWLKSGPDTTENIVEFAAGDGVFSERIFRGTSHKITGMDINPYSLQNCAHYSHFKKIIIGDCLKPPFAEASVDTVIAMHLLHHVSAKEEALSSWSRVAHKVIFNESTPYWISASVPAYLLRKMGLKKAARKLESFFLSNEMQSLEDAPVLDALVDKYFTVKNKVSFLNETVFFLCNLSSFLMVGSYGPPTPEIIRRLAFGPLKRLSLQAARELIYLDGVTGRDKDAFIFYSCVSRYPGPRQGFSYICPDCGTPIKADESLCPKDKSRFLEKDGLLFLLPKEMRGIYESFDAKTASLVPTEHL